MNIVTVIPFSRSKVPEELSYFTASDVPVGAIVNVPLRSKTIQAVVTKSIDAEFQKIDIKNAPFQIRKLGKIRSTIFFPKNFMESCRVLSDYYATNIGSVIDSLVADSLLDNSSSIVPPIPPQPNFSEIGTTTGKAINEMVFAVQGDDADRHSSWRSLIREEFARKKSLVFYVPGQDDVDSLHQALCKGIDEYIFKLHGAMTRKKIGDTWKAIAETEHPIVVIATGSFILLPRFDIDTIIIERENGRGWISAKSPYMDMRHAIETVARDRGQNVYLSDSMLRIETLYRLDRHEISQGSPFKWRSISTARDELVDMRKTAPIRTEKNLSSFDSEGNVWRDEKRLSKFRIISPELEELIRLNQDESTHLFILTARRGMSPTTVCDDCETIVVCRNCSSPMVLHASKNGGSNFFMCHKCGDRRRSDENCLSCGGWRLTPLGVGIENVEQQIRERFPEVDIFRIDADTTKTDKQVAATLENFRTKPGAILLGTEMALPHITDKIDHIAVASLDSLLALPDFRITEKIMYTLVRLRSQATRSILVQTRRAMDKVFEYGLKGNLSDFYRMTLAERKQFRYPPFATLVKITVEGKKQYIADQMVAIEKLLNPKEIEIFPAFTPTVRGNSVIHGLIRADRNSWPDAELVPKLRTLPPGTAVKINPESLL